MKLYYTPGTCSLSAHIALREIGAKFDLDCVDHRSKRTESGENFLEVNPNGYVGALRLDNGEVLSEGGAILLYLAGLSRDKLTLPEDEIQRAQVYSMMFFLSAELHQSFRPLFYPGTAQETLKATQHLFSRIDYVEAKLAGDRRFLFGERPSVADIYVFVMLGWLDHLGIGMGRWPGLDGLAGRIAVLDSTRQALAVETETLRRTGATPP